MVEREREREREKGEGGGEGILIVLNLLATTICKLVLIPHFILVLTS